MRSMVSVLLWICAPPMAFRRAKVQAGTPAQAKLVESEE